MKYYFLYLFLFITFCVNSQSKKKAFLKPNKIGFLYNYANEKNFLFDDTDYYYTTNTFKSQFFYKLGNWKTLNFELIVQPQIQFIKHQLLNEFYVLPSEDEYIERRNRFTKRKDINLYALEFGLSVNKKIIKKLTLQLTASVGISMIDTETERLAKGFTFIENGSLGFSYQTTSKTVIYIGSNVGHVSNFDFQKPNSGYNVVGIELGFNYIIE